MYCSEFPLGINVVNPLTGRSIPVYVANYVLSDFGSLAVLGLSIVLPYVLYAFVSYRNFIKNF